MRDPRTLFSTLALSALLGASALVGCDSSPRVEPPLRPLLHTENGDDEPRAPEGWEAWLDTHYDPHAFPSEVFDPNAEDDEQRYDLKTPDGLIYAAYDALSRGDTAALLALSLDEEGLITLARVPNARGAERAENLRLSLRSLVQSFHPESATDARPDGLSGLIQPASLALGPPRYVDGKLAESMDVAEMVSGSLLRVHILGSSIDFDVRVPRLLRDADGRWWIGEPLQVSDTWESFRRPGLALKPELLMAQHAAFPFDVGNYWHYEVKSIPLDGSTRQEDVQPTRALSYRDTVSDVHNGSNWLVVSLRRTFADPARTPETRHLVITARHIYPCTNECWRRRQNLTFLVGYMTRTTPMLIQPAMRTQSWREGGRAAGTGRAGGRATRVAELSDQTLVVPAGAFSQSVLIRDADGGTGPTIYFSNGVGILREERRQGATLHQANLVQYRIFR